LYSGQNASYNFTSFAKEVADLEYQKILNINGNVLPITSAGINLTLDAYYFYNIKLLTRINIDNTTTVNIYNKNNGFPVGVKSIRLTSSDMQVTLDVDNKKSVIEIAEIDGEFPDEDDPKYNFPAEFNRTLRKFDLQTGKDVQ